MPAATICRQRFGRQARVVLPVARQTGDQQVRVAPDRHRPVNPRVGEPVGAQNQFRRRDLGFRCPVQHRCSSLGVVLDCRRSFLRCRGLLPLRSSASTAALPGSRPKPAAPSPAAAWTALPSISAARPGSPSAASLPFDSFDADFVVGAPEAATRSAEGEGRTLALHDPAYSRSSFRSESGRSPGPNRKTRVSDPGEEISSGLTPAYSGQNTQPRSAPGGSGAKL